MLPKYLIGIMLKERVCGLLILLISFHLSAKELLEGVVVDASGSSIEFATAFIQSFSCGSHTNGAGEFLFTCGEAFSDMDTLVVSHVGYKTVKVALAHFKNKDTIVLDAAALALDVVEVTAKEGVDFEKRKLNYDQKKPYFYYQTNVETNYQLASRIENLHKRKGFVSEIRFRIGRVASLNVPMRIMFFDVDPVSNLPGDVLHTNDIVLYLKKGRNKVDVLDYYVEIPEGDFYVVFEWIHQNLKRDKELDFSVGMIPFRSAYPLLARKGGSEWLKLDHSSKSRILTTLALLMEKE